MGNQGKKYAEAQSTVYNLSARVAAQSLESIEIQQMKITSFDIVEKRQELQFNMSVSLRVMLTNEMLESLNAKIDVPFYLCDVYCETTVIGATTPALLGRLLKQKVGLLDTEVYLYTTKILNGAFIVKNIKSSFSGEVLSTNTLTHKLIERLVRNIPFQIELRLCDEVVGNELES